jgi:hypothetical protein
MRHAENVAEAVRVIYGGRPVAQRIHGGVDRCTAPEGVRRACNGWAYPMRSKPGAWACTAGTCHHAPSHHREGYLPGPLLIVQAERLAAVEPLARHYIRRYMQEATSGADELMAATAVYIMASPGSLEERTCEATIDAACPKHTYERIQAHRHMQQMRLYRHVAARFKAETPWRKAVVK